MKGPLTSEFWLTVLTLIVGGFLAYNGTLTGQEFLAVCGVTGLYSVGRGLAKTETRNTN